MSMVMKTAGMSAVASGAHTTVTASDTVVTGLREVLIAFVSPTSDPIAANAGATVVVPDQVTGPGNITVKTWTSAQVAATTHGKVINWVAFGK